MTGSTRLRTKLLIVLSDTWKCLAIPRRSVHPSACVCFSKLSCLFAFTGAKLAERKGPKIHHPSEPAPTSRKLSQRTLLPTKPRSQGFLMSEDPPKELREDSVWAVAKKSRLHALVDCPNSNNGEPIPIVEYHRAIHRLWHSSSPPRRYLPRRFRIDNSFTLLLLPVCGLTAQGVPFNRFSGSRKACPMHETEVVKQCPVTSQQVKLETSAVPFVQLS